MTNRKRMKARKRRQKIKRLHNIEKANNQKRNSGRKSKALIPASQLAKRHRTILKPRQVTRQEILKLQRPLPRRFGLFRKIIAWLKSLRKRNDGQRD